MEQGIALYTIVWIVSYALLKVDYALAVRPRATNVHGWSRLPQNDREGRPIVGILTIIVIAGLFTFFNYCVTEAAGSSLGGDRTNYYYAFYGYRDSPSVGLSVVIAVIRMFSDDVNVLFYATTFICVFLMLLAYRMSYEARPEAFLLIFLSQAIIFTLVTIKQSYANAFAMLFCALALRPDADKRGIKVACVFMIILACIFHPAGFILIPLYLFVSRQKGRLNITFYILLLLVVTVFFEPLLLALDSLFGGMFPYLSANINLYLGSDAMADDTTVGIFVKGIPYYMIALLGIVHRNGMSRSIVNYDKYLSIALLGVAIYMLALYSGWLYRAIYEFTLPLFVFFDQMMMRMKSQAGRFALNIVIYGGFAAITYRYLYVVYTTSGFF